MHLLFYKIKSNNHNLYNFFIYFCHCTESVCISSVLHHAAYFYFCCALGKAFNPTGEKKKLYIAFCFSGIDYELTLM